MKTVLIIDNYDSFTYNLLHLIYKVRNSYNYIILRNKDKKIFNLRFDVLIISPGPRGPEYTGYLNELFLKKIIPNIIPTFGVCLGMQFIAYYFNSKIRESKSQVHGRTVLLKHKGKDIFSGIKKSYYCMRYNSLEVTDINMQELDILAHEAETRMIMAIRHNKLPITGVQFHPESFLTENSYELIDNFFKLYVEN